MKKLYIGFSRPKGFKIGSELIQLWTKSNFSHSYMRFDFGNIGMSVVFQASHGMVHFLEFENFKEENEVVKEYEIKLPYSDYSETLGECMKLAGQKYGYAELLKILAYDVAHEIGIRLDFGDSRGYICSELMGKLCVDRLLVRFPKPTFLLTPKDIEMGLDNEGYLFKLPSAPDS